MTLWLRTHAAIGLKCHKEGPKEVKFLALLGIKYYLRIQCIKTNTSYVMEPISWLQLLELTSTKMQGLLGIIYYICVSLEHIDTYYIKGY